MLKKILIAVVAVTVGAVVLGKVTHVSWKTMLSECCRSVRNQVPPEYQLKELKTQIDNIDKDIDKNLSKLARMDVEVAMFADDLQAKRDRVAVLRNDIGDMQKSLKDQRERVVYRNHKVDADDLTRQLDMAVTEFTCKKEQVKTQETILAEKKKTLATAKHRISEMKNEKERLRLLAAKLESHLELVKIKQIQNQDIVFDDSAVSQARQTAKDVETRLREMEKLMEYKKQFGVAEKSQIEKEETKSREEVLKAARAALQEDIEQPATVAVDKDEK
jgi:chromosome segregation ATPase